MVGDNLEEQAKLLLDAIPQYNSMLIVTHQRPDADAFASVRFADLILKTLRPELITYPVIDSEYLSEDTSLLATRYGISLPGLDSDVPETIDSILVLDVQPGPRVGLPKKLSSIDWSKYAVHCRDHHKLTSEESLYKSLIVDGSFNSTVSMLLHEFNGTEAMNNILETESLCNIGCQAIKIDTRDFINLGEKDRIAYRMLAHKLDPTALHEINYPKRGVKEGNALAVMFKDVNRMQIEGIATYCHVGIIDAKKGEAKILGKVADEMLNFVDSENISIATAVYKGNGEESELTFSIRAEKAVGNSNASEVAKIFGGNGDDFKAGAQMKLGMVRYSATTTAFSELLQEEINLRLLGSGLSHSDDDQKPIPLSFVDNKSLQEILESKTTSEKHLQLMSTMDRFKMMGDGKYMTLGVNVYENPESNFMLSENDITSLLKINDEYVSKWGDSGYMDVQGNIIYALINQHVKPYVIGIFCTAENSKKPKKIKEREDQIIQDIFGPVIDMHVINPMDIEGKHYKIAVVRAGTPNLIYTATSPKLLTCLDYDMKQRMARVLGSEN